MRDALSKSEERHLLDDEQLQRYSREIFAFYRARDLSPEDAEDLTSEVLATAWRTHKSFDGRSALRTWVYGIAKNMYLRHLRDRGRQKRSGIELDLDGEAPPRDERLQTRRTSEQEALSRERLRRISHALGELPKNQRDSLLLFVRGHTYAEIGQLLGYKEAQISSYVHQARAKLRQRFPEYSPGAPV